MNKEKIMGKKTSRREERIKIAGRETQISSERKNENPKINEIEQREKLNNCTVEIRASMFVDLWQIVTINCGSNQRNNSWHNINNNNPSLPWNTSVAIQREL